MDMVSTDVDISVHVWHCIKPCGPKVQKQENPFIPALWQIHQGHWFLPTLLQIHQGHTMSISGILLKAIPALPPILCRLRIGLYLGQEVHLPQQSAEHLVYVFIWFTHLKQEDTQTLAVSKSLSEDKSCIFIFSSTIRHLWKELGGEEGSAYSEILLLTII